MYQEATLKIKTRPLRLVYLVTSIADLKDAVKLYTHIWGGFSNTIFTLPNTHEGTRQLAIALRTINPDYIFLSTSEIPEGIKKLLSEIPSRCVKTSSNEIEDICNLEDKGFSLLVQEILNLRTYKFPHIIKSLKNLANDKNIPNLVRVFSESPLLSCETALQFGINSANSGNYIATEMDAILIPINSIESLLKMSLLVSFGLFMSPIDITKRGVNFTEDSGSWDILSGIDTLNLFLSRAGDVYIPTLFWNSRHLDIGYSNKVILSEECFIENMERCIRLVFSALPSLQCLHIFVKNSTEKALVLGEEIHNACLRIGRETSVIISHNESTNSFYSGKVYSDRALVITRDISPLDRGIRFKPLIPPHHEGTSFAFGYDAEIFVSSGNSFFMPFSQASCVLVSNRIQDVRYAESNTIPVLKEALKCNKTQPVRPWEKGVSGITIPNEQCCIYLPESSEILSRWFKDFGMLFKLNDHTRYARGFIKRFGGLNEVRDLIASGGNKIFIALDSDRAKACGFKQSQIVGYLTQQLNLTNADAKNIVAQNLPKLLKAGLVNRGYALKCPTCGLSDWYKLDKVDEFVECSGCLEDFQLESLSSWEFSYTPNELASRFLKTDGPAILSTTVALSSLTSYGHMQFGGDLFKLGQNQVFAEIDLVLLVKDYLVLIECKSHRHIDESKANEIIKHLERLVETALLVNAKVVILGVVTGFEEGELFCKVSKIAEDAVQKGIGVHLLLNDTFYKHGQQSQIIPSWRLQVEELLVYKNTPNDDSIIRFGESKRGTIIWDNAIEVDSDTIQTWKEEFISQL